ncbi:heparinase [Niabella ginsenosidivorans]|uniref:Heparinase n=1 Tax=Niabella ginsenosidivorans TaxID=1176587 RepID=A0A1A9IAP2_9BACT|nr:heparinase [Niabella ginsenosidivorans]
MDKRERSVTLPTPRNLLQQQASVQQVKERLLPLNEWVPYPAYHNRNGWAQMTGALTDQLIRQGEKLLDYQWQVIKATDYLEYERSGSRVIMEQPYNANINALARLMIAELAEGKGRFMDQVVNGVWALCDMQSWALSAHLPVQRSKRNLPDPSEQIIDLVSGDVGSLLSWAVYFFKDDWDQINPVITQRVQQNIRKRILEPYMQRSDYWWQALENKPGQLVNNWNPWCNANVLTCFLLLENKPDSLAAAVYRTMRSVDQFLNYIKEDGACEEGPSYWGHAAGKLYDYLQLLSDASGARISIFDKPMIRNMGEYIARSYVGNGWVVNFADASARESSDPGLIYRYGKAVNSREMQSFAGRLLAGKEHKENVPVDRDLFRVLEGIKGYKELQQAPAVLIQAPYAWYPQTEFCYMNNGSGIFFAGKAGNNNESHNHNDIGSFNLYIDAIPFIIDVGVGTYTRQTFSNERYSIWTMQSNYHNLPVINGQPQLFGGQYRARSVFFDAAQKRFGLDMAGAYGPLAAVKEWKRTYTLLKNTLHLEDAFQLSTVKDTTALHYMTWARPVITRPGHIMVKKGTAGLLIQYDPAQLEPSVEPIAVTDPRLTKVWGETVYRLVLRVKKPALNGKYAIDFIKQ